MAQLVGIGEQPKGVCTAGYHEIPQVNRRAGRNIRARSIIFIM